MKRSWIAGVLLVAVHCIAAVAWAAAAPFTVLHFSDVHIGPYLAREGEPGKVRGADTLAWIARAAGEPQNVPGMEVPAPAPDFAVVTGDITEYGVIDNTWAIAQHAIDALPCPWYAVPGNHDNTWVALYDVMRKRHGGANHALDHAGWHFAFVCSASPQEPVPSLDATTRAWLKADLSKLDPGTPIVLAMHHSPEIGEYANPVEMDTFLDLIRDYNVQLILVGHGHTPRVHDIAGIPAIEGGSTFGPNAGYGLLSLNSDHVRYDYRRFPESAKAQGKTDVWKKLYDAPVIPRRRKFALTTPEPGARVDAQGLTVRVSAIKAGPPRARELVLAIDGEERVTLDGLELADAPELKLPTGGLVEGAHLLTAAMRVPGKKKDARDPQDIRTRVFYVDNGATEVQWRVMLPAAVKAGPVIVNDQLVVAGTDGIVRAFDASTGKPGWTFQTGGEVLATPAWSAETLVFGSGDGSVYALDAAGTLRWKREVGLPVYGQPLVADGVVYLGDNGGNMHAIALADGKPKWDFSRADYAIECQPAVWNDALYFGAWDGYLYSVNRADGTLRWRQLGPKSSTHPAFRYYAPADCGPVVAGDRLAVCDRGYHFGTYTAEGTLETNAALDVGAISAVDSNGFLYARRLGDSVRKIDAQGKTIWDATVPSGRFPIPPTVHGGRVYVCGNTGTLTVLNADSGATIWTYRATPGFYVMAPVTVGKRGTCFIAGMDGSVTAVRERNR